MSSEQIWMAAGGAVALILLLLLVALLALGAAVRRSGRRQEALVDRVSLLEAELAVTRGGAAGREPDPGAGRASYVITALEDDDVRPAGPAQGCVEGTVFADIVARESVIRAAGLAHGLRRALAPETRHRIRFEVRREVKRSRKQRRADLKAALRDMQARERARMADQRDEGDAA